MIDPELLKYLDGMITRLIDSQKESEKHIKETFKLTIDPIEKTLERHSSEIFGLFDKDREHRERFGKIEGRVVVLEDDKKDHKDSQQLRVGIWAIVASVILGIGAWIFSLFK